MRNVKFRCALALSAVDAKKKSNHSEFYGVHSG